MYQNRLIKALSKKIPNDLAVDIVSEFIEIRHDLATKTYGRTSPGKLIETVVQILQFLGTGSYDAKPSVEDFLKNKAENITNLDDGLRICMARLSRATYSLRSKRNIAHKGEIDPNPFDLELIHSCAQWIMTEFLRTAQNITMEEAGNLIKLVHAPIGTLVEEIDGHRIVHGNFGPKDKILILLHSHFPERVTTQKILSSFRKNVRKSARSRLSELNAAQLIHGKSKDGYVLTTPGYNQAVKIITKASEK